MVKESIYNKINRYYFKVDQDTLEKHWLTGGVRFVVTEPICKFEPSIGRGYYERV